MDTKRGKQKGKRYIEEVVESGSSTAPKRRSVRQASQASQDSASLTLATDNLRLSSGSGSNYDLDDLPSSASVFTRRAVQAFNISFKPAKAQKDVIPNVDISNVNFPGEYILNDINREMLRRPGFSVKQLKDRRDNPITDGGTLAFIKKLQRVVENSDLKIGTRETTTDSLVDDLLRIVNFNFWPLTISNHPSFNIYIRDDAYVSSIPEFVVMKEEGIVDRALVVIEDKHLKNVGKATDFGEVQIAAEILACGSQNIRSFAESEGGEGGEEGEEDEGEEGERYIAQTIFAVRVISTYVTFYKVEIPSTYWEDLEEGLPRDQKIEIKRWPKGNGLKTGYDLALPDGRRNILTSLVKIRESILREEE